ncbi:MAG: head-tail adaptor protein [Pseudomonadota bacterium]
MIGALKSKITIQTATRIADGGGGASLAWSAGPAVWAEIEHLSSTPDFLGGARRRLRRLAATIRARADIAIGDRFDLDGAIFEVVSIESADDARTRVTLIGEEAAS